MRKWFYLVILLQTLVLVSLAGSSYATGWFGQEVKVKTVPVDPRDYLYGDYVILAYEMSNLDPALWHGENKTPENGTAIYTVLREQDGYYEPTAAYPHKVQVQSGEVLLKGIVQYSWEEAIAVKYGLERFYIPEGTGKDLEEARDHLAVTIKVAPWGQTRITGVEILDEERR